METQQYIKIVQKSYMNGMIKYFILPAKYYREHPYPMDHDHVAVQTALEDK